MKRFEQVPLTFEEDENKNATTWKDGKCVKLDEGRFVTYYVQHKVGVQTAVVPSEEGEREVQREVCMAVPVRVMKGAGTKDLFFASGSEEVFNAALPLYVEDNMESYRQEVASRIVAYDRSEGVNEFFYGGQSMWLSREDRIVIKDRFLREQAAGVETTHLVFKGMDISVTPGAGLQLINAVAAYADQCFDVTQRHLAEVKCINQPEALIHYDIAEGYPDKLKL